MTAISIVSLQVIAFFLMLFVFNLPLLSCLMGLVGGLIFSVILFVKD